MKKKLAIILMCATMISLAACGSKTKESGPVLISAGDSAVQSTDEVTEATEQTTEAVTNSTEASATETTTTEKPEESKSELKVTGSWLNDNNNKLKLSPDLSFIANLDGSENDIYGTYVLDGNTLTLNYVVVTEIEATPSPDAENGDSGNTTQLEYTDTTTELTINVSGDDEKGYVMKLTGDGIDITLNKMINTSSSVDETYDEPQEVELTEEEKRQILIDAGINPDTGMYINEQEQSTESTVAE